METISIEKTIKEGEITLTTGNGVFYNPEANINRDLSVAALAVWIKNNNIKEARVLDAFSGTGISGLRYAKECLKEIKNEITLNDKNPIAAKSIEENIRKNNVKNCKVLNTDCRALMTKEHFTVIDIDPFGTPAPFLDAAARSAWWNGLLMVTATDTAALNGCSPSAGLKKYGIFSGKTDFYTEFGLRSLATAIIFACARHGKAFFPLFCLAHKHYYRVIGCLSFRERDIARMMDNIKMFSYCQKCGNRIIEVEKVCKCKERFSNYGPLFIGKIFDKGFCIDMMKHIICNIDQTTCKEKADNSHSAIIKNIKKLALLNKYIEEPDTANPFYFDVHRLGKLHCKNIRKMSYIVSALKSAGFVAGLSAFCSTGIKTDAPLEQVISKLG